jgi:hypothetical protein
MSQINVDDILPQSGTMINVNGANISKNSNNTIQITASNILRPSLDSVFIGNQAGLSDSSTGGNTFIGNIAGRNNLTGNSNTFIGSGAGVNNILQSLNTYVGWGAGQQNNQDGNTFIGWNAGGNALTTTNTSCIGANAQPSASNASSEFTLGNPFISTLRCAATTITAVSDIRDKKDITELRAGLEFVKELKPVEFVWNDRNHEEKRNIKDFGFIAQDLKKSQEDAGLAETLKLVYESNPEKLEASYGKLLPILVKAIQELSSEVKSLKEELETLKNK